MLSIIIDVHSECYRCVKENKMREQKSPIFHAMSHSAILVSNLPAEVRRRIFCRSLKL